MTKLWKVPSAIVEYTVGTAIVLVQLSLAKSMQRAQAHVEPDEERVVVLQDDPARDRAKILAAN